MTMNATMNVSPGRQIVPARQAPASLEVPPARQAASIPFLNEGLLFVLCMLCLYTLSFVFNNGGAQQGTIALIASIAIIVSSLPAYRDNTLKAQVLVISSMLMTVILHLSALYVTLTS